MKPRPYATSTCSRGPQRHVLAVRLVHAAVQPTAADDDFAPPGAGLVVLLPTLRLQLAASAPGGRHARRASATPLTQAEHARGGCLLRTACSTRFAAAQMHRCTCARSAFARMRRSLQRRATGLGRAPACAIEMGIHRCQPSPQSTPPSPPPPSPLHPSPPPPRPPPPRPPHTEPATALIAHPTGCPPPPSPPPTPPPPPPSSPLTLPNPPCSPPQHFSRCSGGSAG